jgi:hypothetical protein
MTGGEETKGAEMSQLQFKLTRLDWGKWASLLSMVPLKPMTPGMEAEARMSIPGSTLGCCVLGVCAGGL